MDRIQTRKGQYPLHGEPTTASSVQGACPLCPQQPPPARPCGALGLSLPLGASHTLVRWRRRELSAECRRNFILILNLFKLQPPYLCNGIITVTLPQGFRQHPERTNNYSLLLTCTDGNLYFEQMCFCIICITKGVIG